MADVDIGVTEMVHSVVDEGSQSQYYFVSSNCCKMVAVAHLTNGSIGECLFGIGDAVRAAMMSQSAHLIKIRKHSLEIGKWLGVCSRASRGYNEIKPMNTF